MNDKDNIMSELSETKPEFVKIHWTNYGSEPDIPASESMWAKKMAPGLVMIDNVPFFAPYGYGDIVRVEELENNSPEIISIVEKSTNTFCLQYRLVADIDTADYNEMTKDFNTIKDYFHGLDQDIHIEGMIPGICMVAVPIEMALPIFKALIKACPTIILLSESNSPK